MSTTPHDADAPVPRPETLSAREREVLTLFASGMTYVQIARALDLTRHTVDTYLRRVRRKTGLSRATDLIRFADLLNDPPTLTGEQAEIAPPACDDQAGRAAQR